jgi:hypothetical protein
LPLIGYYGVKAMTGSCVTLKSLYPKSAVRHYVRCTVVPYLFLWFVETPTQTFVRVGVHLSSAVKTPHAAPTFFPLLKQHASFYSSDLDSTAGCALGMRVRSPKKPQVKHGEPSGAELFDFWPRHLI